MNQNNYRVIHDGNKFAVIEISTGTRVGIKYKSKGAANAAVTRANRPAKTERPCMCCKRKFNSTGIGNRLCTECRSGGDHRIYALAA